MGLRIGYFRSLTVAASLKGDIVTGNDGDDIDFRSLTVAASLKAGFRHKICTSSLLISAA